MTIPAPSLATQREEWPDADFDMPEGATIQPVSDMEDEDDEDDDLDWDAEMDGFPNGEAKVQAVLSGMAIRSSSRTGMITIRPPLPNISDEAAEEDADEGLSTIKANIPTIKATTQLQTIPQPTSPEDDLESAFDLPEELSQLSLRPLSIHTRPSMEFDRDQTSSSTASSDAYTSLGFGIAASPSSNSTSASTEEDSDSCGASRDEEDLDGLEIPEGMFESEQSTKKLTRLLEDKRKKTPDSDGVRLTSNIQDQEDDFENGLVLDDEDALAPSRLARTLKLPMNRSKSMPTQTSIPVRPSSRLRPDRAKSPSNPVLSFGGTSLSTSFANLRNLTASPFPRSAGSSRLQPSQSVPSGTSTAPSSFNAGGNPPLRPQRSHSSLNRMSPTDAALRRVGRKTSLSSIDTSAAIAAVAEVTGSSSGSASTSGRRSTEFPVNRYEMHTAASRARFNSHHALSSREFIVPPTRPSTPSRNPSALRLTMPASLARPTRTRPSISSVFATTGSGVGTVSGPSRSSQRIASTPPPRSTSRTIQQSKHLFPSRVVRKPRHVKTYGDGTELDGFEDLPTDRDKELRFRVNPRPSGNRVPGGTFKPSNDGNIERDGTVRRRKAEANHRSAHQSVNGPARRPDLPFVRPPNNTPISPRRRRLPPSPGRHRRKPTLIRNLGGTSAPRTVGGMRWDPQTLRWEGNEQVLREFDAATKTSVRPALITHLTGSSLGSPVGSFASGARIVGNMIFDPVRMSWLSTLPPEEEEPDVFADIADADDEGDGWEEKAATIRASQPPNRPQDGVPASPTPSHTRSTSETESSERGSRASLTADVDDSFCEHCRSAEVRHRSEIKGWRLPASSRRAESFESEFRAHLFEIRTLATRQY